MVMKVMTENFFMSWRVLSFTLHNRTVSLWCLPDTSYYTFASIERILLELFHLRHRKQFFCINMLHESRTTAIRKIMKRLYSWFVK